jgi:hypothetical protein
MTTLRALQNGECEGARELNLCEGLEVFPEEILELSETLEILDLSGNRLSDLPESFARLENLRILFLSGNRFTEVPRILGRMPKLEMVGFKSNAIAHVPEDSLPERLRWLILTDNRVRELPASLGERPRLQKLMLAGNLLESLPDLSRSEALQLVRISANRLPSLPDGLLELPRLSWIAWSGNPFGKARQIPSRTIPWSSLDLGELLGQGASGHIHSATLREGSAFREVAVKIFKGEVTSDGYPTDERAASLAAGVHPHLIPLLGSLDGHPEGRDGIVMERVPPGYRNLGGPPSFETCTRDVYPDGTRFAPAFAQAVLAAATSLLHHLHERGLAHGDLYAHNVLVRDDGHALLGDFGAASFLEDLPAAQREGVLRCESRALAALREDLESRVSAQT